MLEKLESIYTQALAELDAVREGGALAAWKTRYIGGKGEVSLMLRGIGALPAGERPVFGKRANEIMAALDEVYAAREALVQETEMAADLETGALDITLPGREPSSGGIHPSIQTLRRFYEIWAEMGFQVYRSRDVETDDMNFTLLNFPPHHPARDMQDTFYTTDKDVILRTHTSAGQIRAMRELGEGGTKPIRVVLPGMCYRFEQITNRSEAQFHQVEGLAIGRKITMSDLKGTVTEFAHKMYSQDAKVRFRTSYFPFTEPGMEIDIECFLCGGKGCSVCKYSGWLEIGGSGVVHPTVLRNGGYDPAQWSGFAFGMGPERITMLKHGVTDIRSFWANDSRFLEQF